MTGKFVTIMATKVSRHAQELPVRAPSGPDWTYRYLVSNEQKRGFILCRLSSDRSYKILNVPAAWVKLTVRITTARIVPAIMIKRAPLNKKHESESLAQANVDTPEKL